LFACFLQIRADSVGSRVDDRCPVGGEDDLTFRQRLTIFRSIPYFYRRTDVPGATDACASFAERLRHPYGYNVYDGHTSFLPVMSTLLSAMQWERDSDGVIEFGLYPAFKGKDLKACEDELGKLRNPLMSSKFLV
jgi:hypothetical protein